MTQRDALNLAAMEIANRCDEPWYDNDCERRILQSYGLFSMTDSEAEYLSMLVNQFHG